MHNAPTVLSNINSMLSSSWYQWVSNYCFFNIQKYLCKALFLIFRNFCQRQNETESCLLGKFTDKRSLIYMSSFTFSSFFFFLVKVQNDFYTGVLCAYMRAWGVYPTLKPWWIDNPRQFSPKCLLLNETVVNWVVSHFMTSAATIVK